MKRLAAILLVATLSACSSFSAINPWHRNVELQELTLQSAADANGGIAFQADVVFILDQNLAAQYTAYTSQNWFAGRESGRILPSSRIVIESYDFAARKPDVRYFELPRKHYDAYAILVFANYINIDLPAISVGEFARATVVFSRSDVKPQETKEEGQ